MNVLPRVVARAGGLAFAVLSFTSGVGAAGIAADADLAAFTDRYCSSCHNDVDKEGGLDLTTLKYDPADAANFLIWVKVHDRVQIGEMPPKEKKRPEARASAAFLRDLAGGLTAAELKTSEEEGRATRRRLNRTEYEFALRDLFAAPWLEVKEQLPEDGEAYKFNKVSYALDVSHVHMARYMQAAEGAMRDLMGVKFVQPPTTTTRYYYRQDSRLNVGQGSDRSKFLLSGLQADTKFRAAPPEQRGVGPGRGRGPRPKLTVGDADPAARDLEAVGWVSSNYVTGFDSRWNNFHAPVTGRYHLSFSGYTVWVGPGGVSNFGRGGRGATAKQTPQQPPWFRPNYDDIKPGRRYEPITVYAQGGLANRQLGVFDVKPEPTEIQMDDVWLRANEVIVTDATRFYRSRPTGFQGGFTNALAQRDGMPAVAFRWMDVEGPLYDDSTLAGYKLLFGDLPLSPVASDAPGVDIDVFKAGANRGPASPGDDRGAGVVAVSMVKQRVNVITQRPEQDAERLMRKFVERAYRRPATNDDVQLFLGLVKQRLQAGLSFAGAMLAGYTAVLSSPEFVFLDEEPGKLDDFAVATRLALFLWNSEPDAALKARAAKGELHRPEVLKSETDRMLADPKSSRFVNAFLDYWLEIRRMDETTPSTTLYNDYYLDDSLTESATAETRLFFAELLRRDLPARNIVDSDFTYINDRLAVHYDIPGVNGVAMRRVALPGDSVRGGFMTQASVLKVTANGTTTSPVLRGKWIMERIVGFEMPPPPAAVPAVEPDIRGAVTIRQQLDKHRADESCSVCHRKIDPPGFALEGFDVVGGAREHYRATAFTNAPHPGFGKNGWPFAFYFALPVDTRGNLPDGAAFQDVREFKKLLLRDEAQIARNFVRQLSVYATGAPVRFSDRAKIEEILERSKASHYGLRTMLNELVQSELFLKK